MNADLLWLTKSKRASKRHGRSEEDAAKISKKSGIALRQGDDQKKAAAQIGLPPKANPGTIPTVRVEEKIPSPKNRTNGTVGNSSEPGKQGAIRDQEEKLEFLKNLGNGGKVGEQEKQGTIRDQEEKLEFLKNLGNGGKVAEQEKPGAIRDQEEKLEFLKNLAAQSGPNEQKAQSEALKPDASQMFEASWWKKHRPAALRDPGLDKKLTEYEIAAERFDYDKMLTLLTEIETLAAQAVTICERTPLCGSIIPTLQQYPAEVAKKKSEVAKNKAKRKEWEDKQQNEHGGEKAAEQEGNKAGDSSGLTVYFECDISQEVLKRLKAEDLQQRLRFKGCRVELSISQDIMTLLKTAGGEATLAQMHAEAQQACQKVIETLAERLEAALMRPQTMDRVKAEIQPLLTAAIDGLATRLEEIPRAHWENWVKNKKAYDHHLLKVGKKIGIGALEFVGAATAVGTSAVPTMGGTLAVGIVLLVKSIVSAADFGVQCWTEADDIRRKLHDDVLNLKESYLDDEGKAKKSMAVKEIGKAVLNEATLGGMNLAGHLAKAPKDGEEKRFGDNPSCLATLKRCNEDFKLLNEKVPGLWVVNQNWSAGALSVMDTIENLKKDLEMVKGDAGQEAKIYGHIKKLRKYVEKSLTCAETAGADITKIQDALPQIQAGLNQLNAENPKFSEIVTTLMPAAVDLLLAGAGATAGFTAAKEALEIAHFALELASALGHILLEYGGTFAGVYKKYFG